MQNRKELKDSVEAQIDFVQPGEMQPERNHNFKGEKLLSDRTRKEPAETPAEVGFHSI